MILTQCRETLDRDILACFFKMTAWFAVIFRQPARMSQYKLASTMAKYAGHACGHWQYLCCHIHRARKDVSSIWFIKEWRHHGPPQYNNIIKKFIWVFLPHLKSPPGLNFRAKPKREGVNGSEFWSMSRQWLQNVILIGVNGSTFWSKSASMAPEFDPYWRQWLHNGKWESNLEPLKPIWIKFRSHWLQFGSKCGAIDTDLDQNLEPLTPSCLGLAWKFQLGGLF